MIRSIQDTITLANGVEMPRLGLGTYKAEEGGDVERAVEIALETGYRSIDTASLYGNEAGIGHALAASGLPRDELFVATKVWDTEQGYEGTLAAMHRSLERLGTDYVDLYLVHWPIPRLMESTWRAMEELLEEGRTRAIGVCNFLEHHLELLDAIATYGPVVNQFEFHPRLQQPSLVAACRARAIAFEAWAPIMRGEVAEIPEIAGIARRHGVTPVQVSIRWILQRGAIAIPKSAHEARIRENADVFGFELDDGEMATIDGLDDGARIGPDPDSRPDG